MTYGYLLIYPADIIHDTKIVQQMLMKYLWTLHCDLYEKE